MKERPVLMNRAMVSAVLDGSKTQTRRIMKPQPEPVTNRPGDYQWPCNALQSMVSVADTRAPGAHGMAGDACPHGGHGDRLWVRETWAPHPDFLETARRAIYRADRECEYDVERWRPSIHMPSWASRILLEIISVRVERLNDCSAADATAEGVAPDQVRQISVFGANYVERASIYRRAAIAPYERLWESINGAGSWAANPWVWVIEFKQVPEHHQK